MGKYAASLDGIEMPDRIKKLPVCEVRKVPVPWFVDWIEKDGKTVPEFRAMNPKRFVLATKEKRCWVCGEHLRENPKDLLELPIVAFVIGPMCAINRNSAEPPSHPECAKFSATACPFLTKPQMVRRENDLPAEGMKEAAGFAIKRNPGCCAVWHTRYYQAHKVHNGILYQIGEPEPSAIDWYCEGRQATREEVMASVGTGLPLLREQCGDDPQANYQLDYFVENAMPYFDAIPTAEELANVTA